MYRGVTVPPTAADSQAQPMTSSRGRSATSGQRSCCACAHFLSTSLKYIAHFDTYREWTLVEMVDCGCHGRAHFFLQVVVVVAVRRNYQYRFR